MKFPKRYTFTVTNILGILVAVIFNSGCETLGEDRENQVYHQLKAGFQDPPISARPKNYWWWLNGYTDTTTMRQELEAMKAAGIGGLDLFEIGAKEWYNDGIIPAGPAFLSDASLSDIKFAVEKAGKLGLEVGFNTASSWNAGGSWIPPQYAAKSLYFSEVTVQGPGSYSQKLPFPDIRQQAEKWADNIEFSNDGKPVFYEEVAVVAYPKNGEMIADTSQIFVLNQHFDAETETVKWNFPTGEWVIQRYIVSNSGEPLKVPSPNSVGPILDHYDPDATVFHFNYIADKLQSVLGELKETAIKYFYLASYEAKELAWTSTLPEAFRRDHGYDLYPYIPIIYGKKIFSEEFTQDFLYDYNQTISNLMIKNHYEKGREFCNNLGLQLASESGGPGLPLHNVPVEALKALGVLNQPRGEFWKRDRVHLDEQGVDIMWLVKEIAAASHIYERKVVEVEAFTSLYQWQFGPGDLKELADRAFCEGMNRVVVHGASHSPDEFGYPGISYFAGTHYNNKRVWYPMIRPFNDYLARISYILQEADFQADVLYYYGDRAPNYVRPKNTTFTAGSGYDYEVINTEKLLEDLYVEDGLLKLPYGVSFKVLALDDEGTMNSSVLSKLEKLAKQGAIIIGAKPVEAPGLHQADIKAAIDALWQQAAQKNTDFSSGKIWSGVTAEQVLQELGIKPDFSYPNHENNALDFIHYANGEQHFYLVRNTTAVSQDKICSFRSNLQPQLWDPVSGKILPIPAYQQQDSITRINLAFAPYQSYFIVFSNQGGKSEAKDLEPVQLMDGKLLAGTVGKDIDLSENWSVDFDPEWGGPGKVAWADLASWTENENNGVKYFSGIANYTKEFDFNTANLANDNRLYLELEQIEEVAKVWLNGRDVGILWSKPYQLDLTEALQNGTNVLKIEVANTWSNRITGDAITGEKYTFTNIPRGPEIGDGPWAEVPLIASGLIGKVKLKTYQIFSDQEKVQ
ncbi:MAG: glycosyl hydrolase [Cyclobacteriaceae bacterium]